MRERDGVRVNFMKKLFLFFILLFLLAGFLLPVADAHAFSLMEGVGGGCSESGNCTFCDILRVIHNVGKFVFLSTAGIAMIMFIIGGLMLIFNMGNAEAVTKSKQLILHTFIAVVIILAAYTIVNLIINLFLHVDPATWFINGEWWQGPTCQ